MSTTASRDEKEAARAASSEACMAASEAMAAMSTTKPRALASCVIRTRMIEEAEGGKARMR